MSVEFIKPAGARPAAKRKPVKATAPVVSLDQPGILRIGNLMAVLGLIHASIYARVADGRLPAPDGHDGRPYRGTEYVSAVLDSRYSAGATNCAGSAK